MELRLTRISITLLSLGLVFSSTAFAEDVYRWKDENGNTHLGRTLPPEYANKPYEILNAQGIVIERVDPADRLKKPDQKVEEEEKSDELEPLFTEYEVRLKSDENLLLRYRSEDKLIEAMENEVAQLGYDTRLIDQSQKSAITALTGQVKNAADRQRAGMPDDPELEREINSLRSRLGRSEDQLAALKLREAKIRASFAENIKRYRYLANGGQPGGEYPETNGDENAETAGSEDT